VPGFGRPVSPKWHSKQSARDLLTPQIVYRPMPQGAHSRHVSMSVPEDWTAWGPCIPHVTAKRVP